MQDTKEEIRDRYFHELSLRLGKEGIETEKRDSRSLRICHEGKPVCDVRFSGDVFRDMHYPDIPEAEELFHRTARFSSMVKEYMTAMEAAPPLPAQGLDPEDGYRLLADYNGYVLAGRQSEHGCLFTTWQWDFTREYVCNGHYAMEDYESAREDFARRSGLVDRCRLFTDEQLSLLHKGLSFLCAQAPDQSWEEQKQAEKLLRQIEYAVPGLEQTESSGMEPQQTI